MSTEKLRSTFFDGADIVFVLLDKDLNLIDANSFFLASVRMKKEDLIGKNITAIVPDIKSSGRFDLYNEVIRSGKTHVIDEMKPHPSFGNYYSRIKAFKVGDGIGIASHNITDLKESLEELETFIYKISHDMRRPISTILGLVNLAKDEVKDLEGAKQLCVMVKEETERLDAILQKLFETMTVRREDKKIQLIDFNDLIDGIENFFAGGKVFKEMKVEKCFESAQKFYSDKQLLVSLLQNLIDNAIKYRKENISDPFIKLTVADQNGGIKITVSDNGIGIPDHSQGDVFKMFFRATVQASGAGLGLYTVNHTVKKLGGSIKLDSKENIGTTFEVYLPNENKKSE
jgi:signal transduction histidine kinase